MNKKQKIDKMLLNLAKMHNVRSTDEFRKDLLNLVPSNTDKFIASCYKDFSRKNYNELNRFEQLKITLSQKTRLSGAILYRYEYRDNSNLRCIFITQTVNNVDVLLCAFNEDGDKKRGKNAYNDNIERAIRIAQKIEQKGEE